MTQRRRGGAPVWTPAQLGYALTCTPEEVLVLANQHSGATIESRREWTWCQTAQRLAWQYGSAEALRRLNSYVRPC